MIPTSIGFVFAKPRNGSPFGFCSCVFFCCLAVACETAVIHVYIHICIKKLKLLILLVEHVPKGRLFRNNYFMGCCN